MPEDLVDDWAAPRRATESGGVRAALVRALERSMPRAVGPALVAASAVLIGGQLFSAYRMVWPSDSSGQFQQGTDDLSMKLAYVIGSSFTAPLITTSLPVLVLAGLARLPVGGGLPVGPALRLAARVIASLVTLVGVVLFVGAAAWTLITHGEVGSQTDGMGLFAVDPVSTFLTRGGDGLATAVLAGVAGWLLWTTSADLPVLETVAGGEAVEGDVVTATPTPLPNETRSTNLADPAHRLGSAVPGDPAPFVTRGATEPQWHQTDPAVFRRPSGRGDANLEPLPDDAEPASTDPALLYRRPVG